MVPVHGKMLLAFGFIPLLASIAFAQDVAIIDMSIEPSNVVGLNENMTVWVTVKNISTGSQPIPTVFLWLDSTQIDAQTSFGNLVPGETKDYEFSGIGDPETHNLEPWTEHTFKATTSEDSRTLHFSVKEERGMNVPEIGAISLACLIVVVLYLLRKKTR